MNPIRFNAKPVSGLPRLQAGTAPDLATASTEKARLRPTIRNNDRGDPSTPAIKESSCGKNLPIISARDPNELTITTPAEMESGDLTIAFPQHLTANFAKADALLKGCYGHSPGVAALIRLWVACGTSRCVQREFERAVLEIKRKTIHPNEQGFFDEDCL